MDDTVTSDSKTVFREIPDGQEWRFNVVKELIDIEPDKLKLDGFTSKELREILTWVCTSGQS